MRSWTEEDASAARLFSRAWRWRIYAMVLIVIAVVVVLLVSKA